MRPLLQPPRFRGQNGDRSVQGYICWTPADVNETVVVDAVNPSPAVFLATHRPSRVLRRDFSATQGGTLIDEEQLLQTS